MAGPSCPSMLFQVWGTVTIDHDESSKAGSSEPGLSARRKRHDPLRDIATRVDAGGTYVAAPAAMGDTNSSSGSSASAVIGLRTFIPALHEFARLRLEDTRLAAHERT